MAQAAKRHSTKIELVHPRDPEREARVLSAMRALETKITNSVHMIEVAGTIMGDTFDFHKAEKIGDGWLRAYKMSEREVEELLFCVYHAGELATELRDAYLAALESD